MGEPKIIKAKWNTAEGNIMEIENASIELTISMLKHSLDDTELDALADEFKALIEKRQGENG